MLRHTRHAPVFRWFGLRGCDNWLIAAIFFNKSNIYNEVVHSAVKHNPCCPIRWLYSVTSSTTGGSNLLRWKLNSQWEKTEYSDT
jgi:hypothetical protein